MNQKKIVWSVLFVLLCCITPIQAKVQGFKEVSKKRYGEDIWHTYQHAQSGLEVIWIENEDVNKAFTIGVKTPTIDDTGVNHIIEHTLFTGSNQYPSPSVFFEATTPFVLKKAIVFFIIGSCSLPSTNTYSIKLLIIFNLFI